MPVPPGLVEAYRKARYRVLGPDGDFELRVGEPSPAADALLGREAASCAALLTAWNPRSRTRDDAANAAAQATLQADLAGHPVHPAEGSGDKWEVEPSLFVAGLSRAEALVLAQRHGQHAFLWLERGGPVELVLADAPA
ncbi:MAG TPA: DUF3293 domain-containing protein [Candidatus Binatia bacterium]|nr:DUF3293 domain-containing protein [Candidatus Binatia bacterium]